MAEICSSAFRKITSICSNQLCSIRDIFKLSKLLSPHLKIVIIICIYHMGLL